MKGMSCLQIHFARVNGRVRQKCQAVKFLDDKPTPGLQRFDNPSQCHFRVRKMHQDQPNVSEVKLAVRKVLTPNIVAAYFQVRIGEGFEEPRVNICSEHTSRNPDARTQPGGDRSSASTNFQTRPPPLNASPFDVADRVCVVELRQSAIPCLRISAAVIEHILACLDFFNPFCFDCFHFDPPLCFLEPPNLKRLSAAPADIFLFCQTKGRQIPAARGFAYPNLPAQVVGAASGLHEITEVPEKSSKCLSAPFGIL